MNHEERVLSKISLIAACFADGVDKGTGIIKAAELSVKWEAEQWEEGFSFGYDAGQDYSEPDTEKLLIERGLIPPQTPTK